MGNSVVAAAIMMIVMLFMLQAHASQYNQVCTALFILLCLFYFYFYFYFYSFELSFSFLLVFLFDRSSIQDFDFTICKLILLFQNWETTELHPRAGTVNKLFCYSYLILISIIAVRGAYAGNNRKDLR